MVSVRVGSRPLSGPPEVIIHGSKVKESRAATRASERSPRASARLGEGGRHLRGPGVPVRARERPRQHPAEGPGPGVATGELGDAVGEAGQGVAGSGGVAATGADVGGQAEHGLGGGVGALGDQPRGRPAAVDLEVLAVVDEHLAVDRVDGEVHPVGEEAGEVRVGVPEGGVALAEGPDRACQPVGRLAVARVGQLDRLGARVEGAVGLHPQHDVAGVGAGDGLQVGQAAQHLVGRVAAVRRPGLLPVADVDDRGAGHVVGVERPLAPGVGGRVVRAAPDAPERCRRRCGRRRSTACRARDPRRSGTSCGPPAPAG